MSVACSAFGAFRTFFTHRGLTARGTAFCEVMVYCRSHFWLDFSHHTPAFGKPATQEAASHGVPGLRPSSCALKRVRRLDVATARFSTRVATARLMTTAMRKPQRASLNMPLGDCG